MLSVQVPTARRLLSQNSCAEVKPDQLQLLLFLSPLFLTGEIHSVLKGGGLLLFPEKYVYNGGDI